MGQELRGIGRTALWVAMMRAAESDRPDRMFDDWLAGLFVAAARPTSSGDVEVPPGASEFLAIRTRFYDDHLLDACAAGVRQVVLLAAGLDSRAFRLGWPAGVRLFELDLPEVFGFKDAVLAEHGAVPACARVPVPVDLREDWAQPLGAAGFDPQKPTAWVAEGLMLYLSAADNDRLVATATALSAPGSLLAFDHVDDSAATRAAVRRTSDAMRRMGVEFRSTMDDPAGFLAGHGWNATTARIPALGASYGRPLSEHADRTASSATILCAGTR
jgi:methyltransferase (TIGR00027 family)